jgi:hypothetical protein
MRPSIVFALACFAIAPSALAQAAHDAASAPRHTATAPSLTVLATDGAVALRDPDGAVRVAHAGDALSRGTQIGVGREGHALVALPNGVTLALRPETRLTAFGCSTDDTTMITTLETGDVQVTAPVGGARLFALSSEGVTTFLGRGDGVVQVIPARHLTRITTHRGSLRAHYAGGDLSVGAGSGMSVEAGRRSHTHELPPVPVWVTAPPAEAATAGSPIDVSGAYGPGGPRRIVRWRTELSRDASFRALIAAREVSGEETRWEGRGLEVGAYFARVIAIDADRYESAPSAVARIIVRGAEIDAGGDDAARLATVRVPTGLSCGLDGAPLALVTRPLRLTPARAHTLRCASRPDGSDVQEQVIPASQSGPIRHSVEVQVTNWGEGIVTVRLTDAEGYGVPYGNVVMSSGGVVSSNPVREAPERGVYRAAIFWRGRLPPPLDLAFTVNDAVRFVEHVDRPGGILAALRR